MSRRSFLNSILVLFSFLLLVSCNNELDVNAPAKDITVAYGVLNHHDSIHYFKVNKAFQTNNDANEHAAEKGMPTYENLSGIITMTNPDNGSSASYTLKDTLLEKESGSFAHEEKHKVYYFESTNLDPDGNYTLTLLINEGEEKEKKITGETELVQDFTVTRPFTSGSGNFVNPVTFYRTGQGYKPQTLEWISGEGGKQYDIEVVFQYKDILNNGDTIEREISKKVGARTANNDNGGEDLVLEIPGESFYQFVGDHVIEMGDELDYRRAGNIKFRFTVAAKDLATYMEVSEPVSSIVQHRPVYTNLDTAAIGIFSSRLIKVKSGFMLGESSEKHLVEGEYTNDLKFKTP